MAIEGTATPLRCPSCDARLVEIDRADVLVDACPERSGVWLDRGELDKILVRERERPPARWEEDHGYPMRDPRRVRPRRSFVEELLDFD
jgi:Zn-finger nucleic acid-binding protein